MALLRNDYINSAGVNTKYWKIIDYRINTLQKYVDITFGGWLTEECRLDNMENSDPPKKVRCMANKFDKYFSLEILDSTGVNPISQMYKFAKDNDEFFTNAVDII